MATVQSVIAFLERFAPLDLAESWDNVGLLLGEADRPVCRVMTCLTVTAASVAEAVAEKAELVVTHHPVLFKPVQRLSDQTAEGRLLLPLLRAGIAVYSLHTAFDNTRGGINDLLASRLGLGDVQPLRRQPESERCKVTTFVPEGDLAKVSDALFAAGAGNIGQYAECSFRVAGVGTFFGSEASNPTVGQKGRREEAREWRLEVVCPIERVEEAVRALRQAHSYEEPAFDVYPLRPVLGGRGAGRVGKLATPTTLGAFAAQVRDVLNAACVQCTGERQRQIGRVALACGAAGDFMAAARAAKADVFLTGEMRFHDYLAAEAQGLALVLPGHYATERLGVEELARLLQAEFSMLDVWASRQERDPAWSPG